MSEHTQRLEVLFDWIVKSDLEGSSYFLDNILGEDSISSSDQKALISFLNAEVHQDLIILILKSNNDTKHTEYLIKNVEFEIDNLESLAIDDSRYFYPLLDENKRIEPNWGNFQHYYDGLRDAPNHLLNEGYQELVDHYPAELSSTIADNLEDVFIWNNDLILEAYTAFIEKIDPEPFNLIENLDWDKIHFLDKNRYLEYSEETLTSLFQWVDEAEENRRLLIKILESFDKDKLPELLKIWLVDVKDDGRRIIRSNLATSIFEFSTDALLQSIIFEYCLGVRWNEDSSFEKDIPIARKTLLKVCENLPNDNLRVKLIIEFFNTITEEDLKDIRAFFAVFDDEQFKKLERNTRTKPIIENNEINQKLVELLLKSEIVKREKENLEAISLVNQTL